jgi:hypothetical protein
MWVAFSVFVKINEIKLKGRIIFENDMIQEVSKPNVYHPTINDRHSFFWIFLAFSNDESNSPRTFY